MRQTINFGVALERVASNSAGLATKRLLIVLLLTLAFFTVSHIWLYVSLSNAKSQVSYLNNLYTNQGAMMSEMTEIVAALADKSAQQEEMSNLENAIRQRQALKGVLEGSIKGTHGFLPALEGLAQHGVEGVWLDNVDLLQGGGIHIKGYANSMEKIPLFADALSAMPVFSQVDFSKMEVQKTKEGIVFELSSTLYE